MIKIVTTVQIQVTLMTIKKRNTPYERTKKGTDDLKLNYLT